MRPAARLGLFAAAVSVLLAIASPASAKPAELANLDVTLLEEQGQTILLVAGQLPETAELPAEMRLAVPTGAELQWLGELMGGDGSADFEIENKKTTADGLDIYAFTVTKSRIAQIEVLIPKVTAFDGTTYVTDFFYTPVDAAPTARVSVRVPASASVTRVGQGETGRIMSGDSLNNYFSKTLEDVKAGEPLSLQFAYVLGAPQSASGDNGSGTFVAVLIGIIGVAAIALAFVAIRRKAAGTGEGASFVFDDEDAETDPMIAAEADTDEDADAPSLVEDASPAKSKAPLLILVGVVAVAVIVGVLASQRSTTAQNLGGAIARTYGTGDACTQASFAITPADGVDIAEQGNTILAALEQVPGIGNATILPDEGRIEIGYCDSSATEDDLRAVLTSTGLVQVGASAAPPAQAPATETAAPSGEATPAE